MTINTVIDSLPVARPYGMAGGHKKRFRGDVSDPGKWPRFPNLIGSLARSSHHSRQIFYRTHQDDHPIELGYHFPYSRHVPDSGFVSQPARLAQSQGHAWCTGIVRSITMSVRF
jgi:hypothetical protein